MLERAHVALACVRDGTDGVSPWGLTIGLIFNGMSHPLFDIYQNVESSKELWDSLEAKYMDEDASSKKFLVSNFTNYKMTDSRPIMEQYNELLGILGRFTQHRMNMDEAIQVSCIIDKLPPPWKDFKHTLKHKKEELTLVELGSYLRIKESLRVQDSDKPKSNNVVVPSVVNMKAKPTCWKCGKTGHIKGIAKVLMLATRPMDDNVAWWVDSGATVHVCKDRCWFKTYESLNDGSILHMGNEPTTLVHGRGCVDLKFSYGKTISLFNVLHVPNIRKNLVSSSILNNCGYKQVTESNKFVLSKHDWAMSTIRGCKIISKDGLIPAFDMDTENDLCDLHGTPSLGDKKYFVTFIDDASRDAIFDENRFSSVPKPSQRSLIDGTKNFGGLVVPKEVTEEVVQQPEPDLRKSKRNKTPKDFRPKFQLYLIKGIRDEVSDQHSYCFNVEDDPKTFDKAIKSQDVAL
ncbi:hypothetical protein Tco_1065311 [Tanacetum coccineum]